MIITAHHPPAAPHHARPALTRPHAGAATAGTLFQASLSQLEALLHQHGLLLTTTDPSFTFGGRAPHLSQLPVFSSRKHDDAEGGGGRGGSTSTLQQPSTAVVVSHTSALVHALFEGVIRVCRPKAVRKRHAPVQWPEGLLVDSGTLDLRGFLEYRWASGRYRASPPPGKKRSRRV